MTIPKNDSTSDKNNEFLFECLCQDIPATFQSQGIIDITNSLKDAILQSYNTPDNSLFTTDIEGSITAYITPRRITIHIKNLKSCSPDYEEEIRGPKTSAPSNALDGFCRKYNIEVQSLSKKTFNNSEHYYTIVQHKGRKISDLLGNIITDVFSTFKWSKSLKHQKDSPQWIRPIMSLVCLFNNDIVPIKLGNIEASNKTTGHFIMHPETFEISSALEYFKELKARKVIIDHRLRKSIITKSIYYLQKNISELQNTKICASQDIINELVGLTEYPLAMLAKIDQQFIRTPPEIASIVMSQEQRYISFINMDNDTLSDRFIFISNVGQRCENISDADIYITHETYGISEEWQKIHQTIIKGNEKVLTARLSDLMFFYKKSIHMKLSDQQEKLKEISFHPMLGSLQIKQEKIEKSTDNILDKLGLPKKQSDNILNTIKYLYVDYTTALVNEMPELHLYMLKESLQNEKKEDIAKIIDRCIAIYHGKEEFKSHEIIDNFLTLKNWQAVSEDVQSAAIILTAELLNTIYCASLTDNLPTATKDPLGLKSLCNKLFLIMLLPLHRHHYLKEENITADYYNIELLNVLKYMCFIMLEKMHELYNKDCNISEELKKNAKIKCINFIAERLKLFIKNYLKVGNCLDSMYSKNDHHSFIFSPQIFIYEVINDRIINTPEANEFISSTKRLKNITKNTKNTLIDEFCCIYKYHDDNDSQCPPWITFFANQMKEFEEKNHEKTDKGKSANHNDVPNMNDKAYNPMLNDKYLSEKMPSMFSIASKMFDIQKEYLESIPKEYPIAPNNMLLPSHFKNESKSAYDINLILPTSHQETIPQEQFDLYQAMCLFGIYNNIAPRLHTLSTPQITTLILLPLSPKCAEESDKKFEEILSSSEEIIAFDIKILQTILSIIKENKLFLSNTMNNFLDKVKVHDGNHPQRLQLVQTCCYHIQKVLHFCKI